MNIFKSLILILSIFNIAFGQSTFPGTIDPAQFNQEPVAAYYNYQYLIGIVPLSNGCNNFDQHLNDFYHPMVTLNDTTLLAYRYTSQSQLSIFTISEKGLNQIEVSPQLQNLVSTQYIRSPVFYDDNIGSYLFINSKSQVVSFNINSNTWSVNGINDQVIQSQYYDLTSNTLYASGISTLQNGSTFNSFFEFYSYSYFNTSLSFYSISDFNLQVEIDQIQISGYQNNVILFGINYQTQKSYIYQLDTKTKTSTLIGQSDINASFVTGVNPRYVLLVSGNKASMELIDLESIYSSQTFSNTCYANLSSGAFLSSIAIKNIFVN